MNTWHAMAKQIAASSRQAQPTAIKKYRIAAATRLAGDTGTFMRDDEDTADGCCRRGEAGQASLACTAIDQRAPDALDLD
jgi:hypothetical protein